jgi:pyrroline-5-carboxylate reductase
MADRIRILQIGCGNMGGALVNAWLQAGLLGQSYIVDPTARLDDAPGHVYLIADPADVPTDFRPDLLILAIKPQMVTSVVPALVPCRHNAAVVSIMAGTTIASLANYFGTDTPIIRTMPNTPAAVLRGVTAALATPTVTEVQKQAAADLFRAAGSLVWLDDETDFDAVTGLAGSGPAYVFHLVEALAAAGEAEGLAPDLAMVLARKTVEGAGALLFGNEADAATLRRNVTSPKGTTEAGLAILMDDVAGLTPLVKRTVSAATARSRALKDE